MRSCSSRAAGRPARREDDKLSPAKRDAADDDLLTSVGAVDGMLRIQAGADCESFLRTAGRAFQVDEAQRLRDVTLSACRYQ